MGAVRIGSLCSGYGGLEMGVQAVLGGTVAWHVEYDKDPARILAYHWPDVPNHGDLTATDWSTVEPVDVLTAGYPCQPFSGNGRRGGENDPRHLWPHVLRAVRVLRPRLIFLENVEDHLTLGFGAVLGDLAEAGLDAEWCVLRASDVGAPHGRPRVFIAATDPRRVVHAATRPRIMAGPVCPEQPPASTEREPRPGARDDEDEGAADRGGFGPYAAAVRRWERVTGRAAPAPLVARAGAPDLSPRFVEWCMGLPPGHVTDVSISIAAQLKALGNGVVPQQAALALRLLLDLERAA